VKVWAIDEKTEIDDEVADDVVPHVTPTTVL
jgi:hypothetical protein